MYQLKAAREASETPLVPAVAPDKQEQAWEYEYLEDLGTDPKARLNELGKEGWALVTANPFIFRRPAKTDESKLRGRVGFGRE